MKYSVISVILIHMSSLGMQSPSALSKPKLVKTIPFDQSFTTRFTKDGKKLIIGAMEKNGSQLASNITVFDTENYEQPLIQFAYPYDTLATDSDPNNPDTLCVANFVLPAQIRSIVTGDTLATLPEQTQSVQTVEYSVDGKQLLFATASGVFCVDVATSALNSIIMPGDMRAARFNPQNNNLIAFVPQPEGAGNGHSTLYVQDLREKNPFWKVKSELPVYGLVFNPKGDRLVSLDAWNFGLYDVKTKKLISYINQDGKPEKYFRPIDPHKGITYADSGKFKDNIFFGSRDDARMVIFDIDTHTHLSIDEQMGQPSDVYQLDIKPDGSLLAVPQLSGGVQLWDISAIHSDKSTQGASYGCDIC